jgi:Uma2 family endonuclease
MAISRTAVQTESGPVSEEEYRRLALSDPQGQLELHHGRLREKPGMSVEHGDVMTLLMEQLLVQLDRREFRVRATHARLRLSSDTYYVPDVAVISMSAVRALRARRGSLDAYPEPLPLVVEIWSPSTGNYDVNEKLADYQRRGDLEIWRIHPYERTLTAWRRQPDGSYAQSVYDSGTVRPASLPNVEIDLDALFEG